MRNPHPFWRYFINEGNAKYYQYPNVYSIFICDCQYHLKIFIFFPEGAGENSK